MLTQRDMDRMRKNGPADISDFTKLLDEVDRLRAHIRGTSPAVAEPVGYDLKIEFRFTHAVDPLTASRIIQVVSLLEGYLYSGKLEWLQILRGARSDEIAYAAERWRNGL